MDRCIAINLRGENEGQQCERKASKFSYCASHLRSKHVKKELESQGIDIDKPVAKVAVASSQNLLEIKPAVVSKPVQKPVKVPKPPRLSKTQLEDQKDKAFAASFRANTQAKLDAGEEFDLVQAYNDGDYLSESLEEPVVVEAPRVSKKKVVIEEDAITEEELEETIAAGYPELDRATVFRRRIAAVNFVKKMSNFGVFVTCGIAESSTPMMTGYTKALMTTPEYNEILDEAAESYADYLGISEVAPEYRLIGLAGMVALEVISINRGLMNGDIRMPVPKDYEQKEEPEFSPAYSE